MGRNVIVVLTGTFVPRLHLNSTYLTLLVAVLGTTISPYLFFWQSAHRLEDMRDEPEQGRRAVPSSSAMHPHRGASCGHPG